MDSLRRVPKFGNSCAATESCGTKKSRVSLRTFTCTDLLRDVYFLLLLLASSLYIVSATSPTPSPSPLQSQDLRDRIIAGIEPCFVYSETDKTFEAKCSFGWRDYGYENRTFISLQGGEIFEGNNHEIDLRDVSRFEGLFRINASDIVEIRHIHTRGGSTSVGGGFIVQSGQADVWIHHCSSSGEINDESGGICGSHCGSGSLIHISSCSSYGPIQGWAAGGVAGSYFGEENSVHAEIVNCVSEGVITGSSSGGIVGYYAGSYGSAVLIRSISHGSISGTYGGGIAGDSCAGDQGQVNISECFSTGDIESDSGGGIVGGFGGTNNGEVRVRDCYSVGIIKGSFSGGIFGYSTASQGSVFIRNVYASGNVTNPSDSGGVFGTVASGAKAVEIRYSVYDSQNGLVEIAGSNIENITHLEGVSGDLSVIRGSLYYVDSVQRWSDEIWALNGSEELPILRFQLRESVLNEIKSGDLRDSVILGREPCFTYDAPNLEMRLVCDFRWGDYYSATAFISLLRNEVFEGNYHTIDFKDVSNFDGLFIINETITSKYEAVEIRHVHARGGSISDYGGFIVQSGQSGVWVHDCSSSGIISEEGGGICGAFCGAGSFIHISSCSSYGPIAGWAAGGIAGSYFGEQSSVHSAIVNCFSEGAITGPSSGGIVGHYAGSNGLASVIQSFSSGRISGTSSGGIAGDSCGANQGQVNISECFSTGNIESDSSGGIVGGFGGAYGGVVRVRDCYSVGSIEGSSSGGIFGSNTASQGNVFVRNVYASGEVTKPSDSAGVFGSVASAVEAAEIRYSVYDSQSGSVDVASNTGDITHVEGVSGDLSVIRGSLYDFNGVQQWSNVIWALNGSEKLPILRFQLGAAAVYELKSGDLRDSIILGREPCFTYDATILEMRLVCDFHWRDYYDATAFISLFPKEVFEGSYHTINLKGVFGFDGLFRIGGNTTSKYDIVEVRHIHTHGGNTSVGGGFIVQSGQSGVWVYHCSSSGEINDESGGICGSHCGADSLIYISSCSSYGAIQGWAAGGIAGSYFGEEDSVHAEIVDCFSEGAITGSSSGGIAGYRTGSGGAAAITRSYSHGTISASYGGGIVGKSCSHNRGQVNVSECFSTGDVEANSSGGVVGSKAGNFEGIVLVHNCYAVGRIMGSSSGGIFGSSVAYPDGSVYVSNVYSSGFVDNPLDSGGIFGSIATVVKWVEIRYSVFDSQAGSVSIAGLNVGLISISEGISGDLSDIRGTLYHFNGVQKWSNDVWAINATNELPLLRFYLEKESALSSPFEGSLELRNSIIAGNERCFHYIPAFSLFSLVCSFVGAAEYQTAVHITLFGNETFDGRNLRIDLTGTESFPGLFRVAINETGPDAHPAVIRRLEMFGGTTSEGGGFILQKGQTNAVIEHCSSTGNIMNNGGGICGEKCGANFGRVAIENCSSTGKIKGENAGGIIGAYAGAQGGMVSINECYSSGMIYGIGSGGLCGQRAGSEGIVMIRRSHTAGIIYGSDSGGLTGVSGGYKTGVLYVSQCFSTGEIEGQYSGGFCGGFTGGSGGQVWVENSYTRGTIGGTNTGGILGSDVGSSGNISLLNVYASGKVLTPDSSAGLIGRLDSTVERLAIRYSVFDSQNGSVRIMNDLETNTNRRQLSGTGGSSVIIKEGNSGQLVDILGKLYRSNGTRRWSDDIWAVNKTDEPPVLRFQLVKPNVASITPTVTALPSPTATPTASPTSTITPTMTPSNVARNLTEGEVVSSACGSINPFNCVTALYRKAATSVFRTDQMNSTLADASSVLSVQSSRNFPTEVQVQCSPTASTGENEIIYSGCQEQYDGTNLDLPFPVIPKAVLISNTSCASSSRAASSSCRALSYEVRLFFHPDALSLMQEQVPLLREKLAASRRRQLDDSTYVLLPVKLPISVEGETIISASQSMSIDISQVVESTTLDVSLNPQSLFIDQGRSGSGVNASKVIERFVILNMRANQQYVWSKPSDLEDIAILPPSGITGNTSVSREMIIGFDIEQASQGLLESFLQVLVSDVGLDLSTVLQVAISLRVREGEVKVFQDSIDVQMSSAEDPTARPIQVSNDGDYMVNWRTRLFTDAGKEISGDKASSFWVRAATGDLPINGSVAANVEQKTLVTLEMVPRNANSSGLLEAWFLIETDSRSGEAQSEFEDPPPSVGTTIFAGQKYWVRLSLLVTSVFVCPERSLTVDLLPYNKVSIQWDVLNVADQPVFIMPREFTFDLGDGLISLHSTVEDNGRTFGNWLQFSPSSAAVNADNQRTFQATLRYPQEMLTINNSQSTFSAFNVQPKMRYTLSILTMQQWLSGEEFADSGDTRDLSVEVSFIPGSATATNSRLVPKETRGFVGEEIQVDVVLADTFGNTPAFAVFSGEQVEVAHGGHPSLSVVINAVGNDITDSDILRKYPLRIAEGDDIRSFSVFVTFKTQGQARMNVKLNNVSIEASDIMLETETVDCPTNEVPNSEGSTCLCKAGYARQRETEINGESQECRPCPAGRFLPEASNEESCNACPSDHFSLEGSSVCIPCPSNGFECFKGQLLMLDGYWCEVCTAESPLYPKNQSVRSFVVDTLMKEGSIRLHECDPSSACIVNNTHFLTECSEGRTGPLCDSCKDGWVKTEDECLECVAERRNQAVVGLWSIVAVSVLIGLNIREFKRESAQEDEVHDETVDKDEQLTQNSGDAQVYKDKVSEESIETEGAMDPVSYLQLVVLFGMDYLQISSILGEIQYTPFLGDARWYREFSRLFLMDPTRPDAFGCVSGIEFFRLTVISLLFPWVIVVVSYWLQFVIHKSKRGQQGSCGQALRSSLNPIAILLGQIHTATTMTVVSVYNVYPFEVFGEERLRADFSITTDDTEYTILASVAGFTLATVVLGLPTFLVVFLTWKHHTATTETRRHAFLNLIDGFRVRNHGYLWPAMEIFRKSILILLAFLVTNAFHQVISVTAILIIFMIIAAIMRPYKLESPLNKLEMAKSICIAVTSGLGLLRHSVDDSYDEAIIDYVVLSIQIAMVLCLIAAFIVIFVVACRTTIIRLESWMSSNACCRRLWCNRNRTKPISPMRVSHITSPAKGKNGIVVVDDAEEQPDETSKEDCVMTETLYAAEAADKRFKSSGEDSMECGRNLDSVDTHAAKRKSRRSSNESTVHPEELRASEASPSRHDTHAAKRKSRRSSNESIIHPEELRASEASPSRHESGRRTSLTSGTDQVGKDAVNIRRRRSSAWESSSGEHRPVNDSSTLQDAESSKSPQEASTLPQNESGHGLERIPTEQLDSAQVPNVDPSFEGEREGVDTKQDRNAIPSGAGDAASSHTKESERDAEDASKVRLGPPQGSSEQISDASNHPLERLETEKLDVAPESTGKREEVASNSDEERPIAATSAFTATDDE